MGKQASINRTLKKEQKRRMAREELRVRKVVESEIGDLLTDEQQKSLIDKIVMRNTTAPIQYESEGLAVEVKMYADRIAAELDGMGLDTVVLSSDRSLGEMVAVADKIRSENSEEVAAEAIGDAEEVWSDGRISAHQYTQHGVKRLAVRSRDGGLTLENLLSLRSQLGEGMDILIQIHSGYSDATAIMVNLLPSEEPMCSHGRAGACPHCVGA